MAVRSYVNISTSHAAELIVLQSIAVAAALFASRDTELIERHVQRNIHRTILTHYFLFRVHRRNFIYTCQKIKCPYPPFPPTLIVSLCNGKYLISRIVKIG